MKKNNWKDISSEILHKKIWIYLRNGNLKRETESLLMAAQNNAIRTSYVKAKIDKTNKFVDIDYVLIDTKLSII